VVVVEVVTIVSLELDLAELEIGKPIPALLFQHKEILEEIVPLLDPVLTVDLVQVAVVLVVQVVMHKILEVVVMVV
jgi:hypothetical protein|tara:strand:- start:327 stop:554 length:228 start_codon:yes stop_codon:yes gene_type:complete